MNCTFSVLNNASVGLYDPEHSGNEEIVCNQKFLRDLSHLQKKLNELPILKNIHVTSFFKEIHQKIQQVVSKLEEHQKLDNYQVSIVGGYAIYLFGLFLKRINEHSLEFIQDNLETSHLISIKTILDYANRKVNDHNYFDIDIQLGRAILNEEVILDYLYLCKRTNYKPKINDIKLLNNDNHTISFFKEKYFAILGEKYPYNVLKGNTTLDCYLHLTFDQMDISFIFDKSSHLFSLDAIYFSIGKNCQIVTKEENILQSIVDYLFKIIKFNNIDQKDSKSLWKAWHYFTKGYRCLNVDDYSYLEKKSIPLFLEKGPYGAISMIKELTKKHSLDNDCSYAYALFTFVYHSNFFSNLQIESIKASLGQWKGSNTIYKKIIDWQGNLETFYHLIRLSAYCRLIQNSDNETISIIEHLGKPHLQICDRYVITIPFNLSETYIHLKKAFFSQDFLINLLNRIAPLVDNNPLIIHPFALSSIEIGLFFLKNKHFTKVGFHILLLIYNCQSIPHDTDFIESIPLVYISLTDKEKEYYTPFLINFFAKVTKRNLTILWLKDLLLQNDRLLMTYGYLKYLQIDLQFASSSNRLSKVISESQQLEARKKWILFYHLYNPIDAQKDALNLFLNNQLPFETLLGLYQKKSEIFFKSAIYEIIINKSICPIPSYESIFWKALKKEAQENFLIAFSYWKKFVSYDIKHIGLDLLQKSFINISNKLLSEEKYHKLQELHSSTNELWNPIFYYSEYATIIGSLYENLYPSDNSTALLNGLEQIIKKITPAFDKHGSVFCLVYLNYFPSRIYLHEDILKKIIKTFKKNRNRPLLEEQLLEKIVYELPIKNCSSDLLLLVQSLIIQWCKKPNNVNLPLIQKFLEGGQLLKALDNLLECKSIPLEEHILRLEVNLIDKVQLVTFLNKYIFQIILQERSVNQDELLRLISTFYNYIDKGFLNILITTIKDSKDNSVLKFLLEIIDQHSEKEILEEVAVDLLKKIMPSDGYFGCKYIGKLPDKEQLKCLLALKKQVDLPTFYALLMSHNLFEIYFQKDLINIYEDFSILVKQKNDFTNTIASKLLEEAISSKTTFFFVTLLKALNEIPSLYSSIEKKVLHNFVKIGIVLRENDLLDLWCALGLYINEDFYLKGVKLIKELLLEAIKSTGMSKDAKVYQLLIRLTECKSKLDHKILFDKNFVRKGCEYLSLHLQPNAPFIAKNYTNFYILQKLYKIPNSLSPIPLLLKFNYPQNALLLYFTDIKPNTVLTECQMEELESICKKHIENDESICENILSVIDLIPQHLGKIEEIVFNDLIKKIFSLKPDLAIALLVKSKKITSTIVDFLFQHNLNVHNFYQDIILLLSTTNIVITNPTFKLVLQTYEKYVEKWEDKIECIKIIPELKTFILKNEAEDSDLTCLKESTLYLFNKIATLSTEIIRKNYKLIIEGFFINCMLFKKDFNYIFHLQSSTIDISSHIKLESTFTFCLELVLQQYHNDQYINEISIFTEMVAKTTKLGLELISLGLTIPEKDLLLLFKLLNKFPKHLPNDFFYLIDKELSLEVINEFLKLFINYISSKFDITHKSIYYIEITYATLLTYPDILTVEMNKFILEKLNKFSHLFSFPNEYELLKKTIFLPFEKESPLHSITTTTDEKQLLQVSKSLADYDFHTKKMALIGGISFLINSINSKKTAQNFPKTVINLLANLKFLPNANIDIPNDFHSQLNELDIFDNVIQTTRLKIRPENIKAKEFKFTTTNYFLNISEELQDIIETVIETILSTKRKPSEFDYYLLYYIHYHFKLLLEFFPYSLKMAQILIDLSLSYLVTTHVKNNHWATHLKFCQVMYENICNKKLKANKANLEVENYIFQMLEIFLKGKCSPSFPKDEVSQAKLIEFIFGCFEKNFTLDIENDFRINIFIETLHTIFVDNMETLQYPLFDKYFKKIIPFVLKNPFKKLVIENKNKPISYFRNILTFLLKVSLKYDNSDSIIYYFEKAKEVYHIQAKNNDEKNEIIFTCAQLFFFLPNAIITFKQSDYLRLLNEFILLLDKHIDSTPFNYNLAVQFNLKQTLDEKCNLYEKHFNFASTKELRKPILNKISKL